MKIRWRRSGEHMPRLGLAKNTKVESVKIRWLSEAVQAVTVSGIDQIFAVVEGCGVVRQ